MNFSFEYGVHFLVNGLGFIRHDVGLTSLKFGPKIENPNIDKKMGSLLDYNIIII